MTTARAGAKDTEFNRSGTTVAVVIFALMFAGLVYRYWRGDERDILRHVSNLAEALSLSKSEGEALSATRFAALREYFAPEVRVRFDGQEIVTRETLLERLRAWTPPPGGIAVEFVDIKIDVADGASTATVTLTARVSAQRAPASESKVETRSVTAAMIKLDNDWVIATADAGPPR
jgi:hypothetical protein